MSQFSNTYFCIMKTNNVEQYFKTFIDDNKLNTPKIKFLLAVSGGVDSIVLLSLFIKSKLNFSVCSCDFSLRGNDAKKDILHVKKICSDKKIKFFSKVFDTNKYSKSNKISIQMASRDLRYNWFKNLMRDNSIDYLVTAHHSDDNYETIIFNLLKTTGYKGLIGIPHFNNKIIRPLINVEKMEIVDYAKKNKLVWREDKTNNENKYSRNMIRNKLIPIISKINPSFKKSILESSKRMDLVNKLIQSHLEIFKEKYVEEYKHLFHYVTSIQGILKNKTKPKEIIKSMMPGGSVIGCPKIKTLELLNKQEKEDRNIFTGSFGYIKFNQDMRFNIIIRSILNYKNISEISVASGVVIDSTPKNEFNENYIKAKSLMDVFK
mgnify:CR=1 FL=1